MLRKSRIYDCLKRLCQDITQQQIEQGFDGITAAEIAQILDLDRANTSKELNQLQQDKMVIKTMGRPVYYFDVECMEQLLRKKITQFETDSLHDLLGLDSNSVDDFYHVIGSEESLKTVIKKAKAAMIYPPFGLHTLLVGPTGSGKTMFAEIMFHYAVSYGVLDKGAQFVIFNCAEYADNPQLLLSQLFGYVKGAYTGADVSSDGLVEKARGGVLFLDEVHRLPPEGQEMLFMLMDRGEYRKLGANENVELKKILIIAATTENLESSLLQTFLRRIPMNITMPSLDERSMQERYDLIEKFFRQEYNQVRIPIHVNHKVICALLSYECKGNIGQLKADIRLLCANGFLAFKMKDYEEIKITTNILQDHIYRGLLNSTKQKEIKGFLKLHDSTTLIYDKETSEENYDRKFQDIYKEINHKFHEYEIHGVSAKEANDNIQYYINQYTQSLFDKAQAEEEEDVLHKIIPLHIYHATEIALQLAGQKLRRTISQRVCIAMALHISALMEHKRGSSELTSNVQEVLRENPNEYIVAKEIRAYLEKELEIMFDEQELIFFTMFLCIGKEEKISQNIALLVIAHGNGVARNMVDVANTLLHTRHGHALDMSLHQNVDEFLTIVTDKVKEIDEGKGVLLLVDMGSLLSFGEMIMKNTGIAIRTIDMATTPFVLEALRKTMLSEYELDALYKELRSYTPYIGKLYTKEKRTKEKFAIITTCITGEGAAIKLGDLIRSALPLIKDYLIEIIPCNKETFYQKDILNKTILAVVGAIDLQLQDVIYISSDRLILEDGLPQLNQILQTTIGVEADNLIPPNFMTNNFLKESLIFLDPSKADVSIRKSFKMISKMYQVDDYNRVLIGYMLHVGCMIERCVRRQEMEYDDYKTRIQRNEKLYRIIRTGMKVIEDEFQIVISDTEVTYIMDIFDTE
ncbi:sigma 54-interacting transcriptional regulator [Amedibacillus sp. YH-ame6]